MRSLILGGGGQIGAHLVAAANRRGHTIEATWHRRPLANGVPLDICDIDTVRKVIADFEPDAIFLAAGMSQVDYAETHAEECFALAIAGTESVARAAAEVDALVVLFTSEQTLGECPHPANEASKTAPQSIYAEAQVAAEHLLRGLLPCRHLIVRTCAVYGPHDLPRNIALHGEKRLREGHVLRAAKDRFFQPTYAVDLAEATLTLVEKEVIGTIHVVGGDRITEASFIKQIAFLHGLDCDLVEAVPAASLGEEAPRPLSPWLDRSRLISLLGSQAIRTVGEGLRAIRDSRPEELRRTA